MSEDKPKTKDYFKNGFKTVVKLSIAYALRELFNRILDNKLKV